MTTPQRAGELDRQVTELFAPRNAGQVGVEVELIPVRGRPARPVAVADTVSAIGAHDPALLADACVTFEPGGQVELSPPPRPSLGEALAALDGLIARLDGALAAESMVAVSSGLNPWHGTADVPLQLDAERYRLMQQHFDGIASAGREMMRLTASLQVCVDMADGDDGAEQWLLANRMGPGLSAVFANSGVGARAATGWTSTRSHIWQRLDPARTGFDGAQVSGDAPAAAYVDFAAAVAALPLSRDSGRIQLPAGTPFGEWAGGDALSPDGATGRPDAGDVAHHLTTLFPPVRPRGYLEVRYLDAPPRRGMALAVSVVAVLLQDAQARRAALAALQDTDRGAWLELWEASAHQGVVNPWLRHEALALLDIAHDALRRIGHDASARHLADFCDAYPRRRRTWSDDQVDRITGSDAEDATAWT
ncbi:MAG TPA: glutamate-cysteine ligase family protein [Candidatus Dormibacteraeota bacterium]|nr:glutamate-cysteine ligase family protein [Candidatus Dormibacteraeota bacterium]